MKKTDNVFLHLIGHVKYFLRISKKNNIASLSGRSAFFMILSFIPFLMFVFSIIALFFGDNIQSSKPEPGQYEGMNHYTLTIFEIIINAVRKSSSGFAVVNIIVALWSAGNGIYTITDGISRIYRLPNKRIWLIKRIAAMGYTLVILLLLTAAMLFMVIISMIVNLLMMSLDNVLFTVLISIVKSLVLKVILIVLLTLSLRIYLHGWIKDKRLLSFKAIMPGMTLVVIAWDVLTAGVEFYITFFSASSIYGSLGTVVVIMMWVYFMIYIFLYGVQFNHLYRCRLMKIFSKKAASR